MLNSVTLMGRLVADPELKTTQNGTSVAAFRLAVERNYQPKTAEFIGKYFTKGRMIAVEGSLQSRNYEDKNGQKRTAYEVIVDQAYFADSRPAAPAQETPPAAPPAAPPPVPAGDPAAAYVQTAQYGLPGDVHYRGTLDVDFAEDDPYSGDLPF